MKQIYAFETKEEYGKYRDVIERFSGKLEEYQHILEDKYSLTNLPKGVVWTSEDIATTVFSDLPVPAYTNRDVIYVSPDLPAWRKLLINQIEEHNIPEIKSFYENCSEDYLFTILAHQLTRYSNVFVDKDKVEKVDNSWFEEGMCEYLSRKLVLSEEEFKEITTIELELVEVYKEQYGTHSLEEFGRGAYQGNDLINKMFDYWRSYLAVEFLVEVRANNDVDWILNEYQDWDREGRVLPLTEHFEMENFFN
ncbi:hypothetical protein GCM10010954_23820 [Halobacillus andaensis]|uniref:Uncharacterized protein n=1 Tax=Halobacillus andaensis TaxID=1176239 RepID=A0A917B526_HALAA|nr:hypothetical protein [Halobacillus andaensis]MBP2006028.1 hypothetical protein [Halobacillus andaensis]GGF24161.1 hypothetical protein GCM10010954_23820 [Halobacillus andaensis]